MAGLNGKAGEWLWRIGTALLATVLAWGVLSARVSVLEQRMDDLKDDVRYIRQRIDQAIGK